jgi:hypothetical protein
MAKKEPGFSRCGDVTGRKQKATGAKQTAGKGLFSS